MKAAVKKRIIFGFILSKYDDMNIEKWLEAQRNKTNSVIKLINDNFHRLNDFNESPENYFESSEEIGRNHTQTMRLKEGVDEKAIKFKFMVNCHTILKNMIKNDIVNNNGIIKDYIHR